MKKIIAILALVCVLAAAGCNNGNANTTTAPATTTAPTGEGDGSTSGKKVTAVAYEAEEREDTTADSLKFIEQKAPAFYNYIKLRRSAPLVFEAKITKDGQVWESGTYIKDADNFAQSVKNPDGTTTKVVYKRTFGYQIEDAKKVVYTFDFGDDRFKEISESMLMSKIYLEDISEMTYTNDTAEYNGTEYDRVTITGETASTEYYFDKTSGSLVYLIEGSSVTEITRLENAAPDDSLFDVPADYEQKTDLDYYNEIQAENAAQTAAAE